MHEGEHFIETATHLHVEQIVIVRNAVAKASNAVELCDKRKQMDTNDTGPQRLAQSLIDSGETTVSDIWLKYWGAGGSADIATLEALIHSLDTLPPVHRVPLMEALGELAIP